RRKRMSKTKLALNVVNDLRSLAMSIEDLVIAIESNQPEKRGTKESTEAISGLETKQPTLEEVRAKLAALSQDGKQQEAQALITELAAKKLSDVPAEKYVELLKKAEEL